MANNITYGVNFPFKNSKKGFYFDLTTDTDDEIRANLLHLIFTRKGSRYYLPDFGTRIYDFIFEPMDNVTFESIKSEIRESIDKYIPNLELNNITIEPYSRDDSGTIDELKFENEPNEYQMFDIYRTAGKGVEDYTAKIKIDYSIKDDTFSTRDFVVINI